MPSAISIQAVMLLRQAKREAEEQGLLLSCKDIAQMYDTYETIVKRVLYVEGFEMGTTLARRIVCAHMGRIYKGDRR